MKKVLFVCSANVCRSPMAEAIFNALAEDKGLPWRAESAGVGAIEDAPADENAGAVLEEAGIPHAEQHRSRQADREALGEASLVLTMTEHQAQQLRARFPESGERVHTLTDYAGEGGGDVSDPIGGSMTSYRTTVRRLYWCIKRIADVLDQPG